MTVDLDRGSLPRPLGREDRRITVGFAVLLALLVLLRSPHLAGQIDEPNAHRQCDTAHYAMDLYQRGFDLLHPAVNWMGAHRTVALEFPLPEALMAAVYHAAGPGEDRARALTLLFFAGCVWYLFLLIRRWADPWTAFWSAGVYALLPLSWFYSRALLIDYYTLFFAHAWAYHWVRAADEGSDRQLLIGAALLGFGALIKAPLLLPIGPPLLWWVGSRARRDLPKFALAGLAAIVPFLLWRWHSEGVNRAMPDWFFLPDYVKHSGLGVYAWYFGDWEMRFASSGWVILGRRLWGEVLTLPGAFLFVTGTAAWLLHRESRPKGGWGFFLLWLAGSVLYVLLFYPLNVNHNYYQLPLLAPAALGIGAGLEALRRGNGRVLRRTGPIASALAFCLVAGSGWSGAERDYYLTTVESVSAGRAVRTHVPPGALVVVSYPTTTCRDPRLLYYAQREGWAVPPEKLTPLILQALRKEGAEYLALIGQAPPADPGRLPPVWTEVPLEGTPWRLWLYRLTDRVKE